MRYPNYFKRRTKIVCTIGPATSKTNTCERLIRSGMNIARLNLSHGTKDVHTQYIRTLRMVSQRLGIRVAILIDLPGPKYRIGRLKASQVILKNGANVILTTRNIEGDASIVPINRPNLLKDINTGDTILIDDGAIQLRVIEKQDNGLNCRISVGGILTEGRGLVVPKMRISGPFVTDILREYLAFAIQLEPDYLAISFASTVEDICAVRFVLREHNVDIPIISKIERGQAVSNFNDILSVSDGIMVARGDLGADIPLEKIPLIQKEIIHKCNSAGKPVITATQMLESMVSAARPSRAEVTDVANAILDGTDAIMLSEETSIGKYPLQTVRTMDKIAVETERELFNNNLTEEKSVWIERETDELISYSACHTANALNASAIVAFTQSGSTAKRVSKYRPRVPILAITPNERISNRLLLHWGVFPLQTEQLSTVDELFYKGIQMAKKTGLVKTGDLIVITGGVPIGVTGSTNLLKVERIN